MTFHGTEGCERVLQIRNNLNINIFRRGEKNHEQKTDAREITLKPLSDGSQKERYQKKTAHPLFRQNLNYLSFLPNNEK